MQDKTGEADNQGGIRRGFAAWLVKSLQRERTTATGLVPVVLLAAVWSLETRAPSLPGLAVGSFLAVIGEAARLWAGGNLDEKAKRLVQTGPYSLVRHPLYLGSALVGLGFCTASGLWWSYLLIGLVFAVFYIPSIILEERHLAGKHGAAFDAYRQAVPALTPRFRGRRGDRRGSFCWRNVVRNKEHHYAAMTAVLMGLFWARFFWGGAPGAAG
jgi:protein-S-isoprenylcysteine O-methyltransferase Ste14